MKNKTSEKDLKRKIETYRQALKRAFGTSDLRKISKFLDEIDEEVDQQMQERPFYVA